MKEASYRKHGLVITHVWFSEELEKYNSDICIFHGMKEPLYAPNIQIQEQDTLITNLSIPEDELWKAIKKNTKYEIRRAEKEGVVINSYDGNIIQDELLSQFRRIYNEMYKAKNMRRYFNMELVKKYIERKMIYFSVASYKGEALVFHSYIYDNCNTRFFYSCSPFRNDSKMATMIGRMNRYLHWHDILEFKGMGIKEYDWGGINSITIPDNIAHFKMGFGGCPERRYNIVVSNTFLGAVALRFRKMI